MKSWRESERERARGNGIEGERGMEEDREIVRESDIDAHTDVDRRETRRAGMSERWERGIDIGKYAKTVMDILRGREGWRERGNGIM